MAARPYWSGTIRMSLVSLPVNMYSALESGRRIQFHQIFRDTGERVRQKLVAGDVEVERDDIVKGFEYEKGEYVLFEQEEINDLKIPSSKHLEIVRFVAYDAVDPIYYDTPYYLAPEAKSHQATFAVIRDSLRDLKVMGLGQIVISGRERLCSIKPCGSGLLLETLHYEEDIRESDPYFGNIRSDPANADEVELAKELIKRKLGDFVPEEFHDNYYDAVKELVEARAEQRTPKIERDKPSPKVVNLMDALRASLRESAPAANDTSEKPKAAPRKKKTG